MLPMELKFDRLARFGTVDDPIRYPLGHEPITDGSDSSFLSIHRFAYLQVAKWEP